MCSKESSPKVDGNLVKPMGKPQLVSSANTIPLLVEHCPTRNIIKIRQSESEAQLCSGKYWYPCKMNEIGTMWLQDGIRTNENCFAFFSF